MCDLCDSTSATKSRESLVGRRTLLAGTAGVAGALGLAGIVPSASAATDARNSPKRANLEVVLLGTQAGPPIVADRTGIASALIVDGHVYVVDCGRAAATQYVRAGLGLGDLEAIFLTHLHADHLADFYNFFLLGGYVPQPKRSNIAPPVHIYGPGPAGGLPSAYGGASVPTVNPSNPTPGTRELLASCNDAFAYSSNVFMRDSGIPDIETLYDVHEVQLPDVGSSYTHTAPAMQPFVVMQDERVKVSAILVPHGPAYPAFAYRFDTEYGSVTFSGDTTYTPNIPTIARNTDLLVHEAINVQGADISPVFKSHLLTSHVEIQKVGPVAQEAGAKRLVISHMADLSNGNGPINAQQWRRWAQKGYTAGKVSIGEDLQRIQLGNVKRAY